MQVNTEAYNWVQLTKFTCRRVSLTYCIGASAAWDFLRGLISAHSTDQAISNVKIFIYSQLNEGQWNFKCLFTAARSVSEVILAEI